MIPISALYWQTLKLAVIYTLSESERWQPISLHEYMFAEVKVNNVIIKPINFTDVEQ